MDTANTPAKNIFPTINSICQRLEQEFHLIPEERQQKLLELRHYIANKLKWIQTPKLIVICTHNSRRSHIGQIWLAVAADYYKLPPIETFSGGTEATAFNARAVSAFRRIGFEITTASEKTSNPVYQVKWQEDMQLYEAFSKTYDSSPNPTENFAAIMVCIEADKGCPLVIGCDFRLALPYDDPKAFDDTDLETEKYDERVLQIGREILFAMHLIK